MRQDVAEVVAAHFGIDFPGGIARLPARRSCPPFWPPFEVAGAWWAEARGSFRGAGRAECGPVF
jgi:hypothetical protein